MGSPAGFSYNSPVSFFIGQVPPEGVTDPAAASGLAELYGAVQNIIQVFINNCGIGPQDPSLWTALAGGASTLQSGNLTRFYATATEAILFGALINITPVAGVCCVRNANATDNTRPADGYCSTQGGISSNAAGECQLATGTMSVTGLTPGTRYWLSTVNGLLSTVPATAAGNIEQYIGIAIDATDLFVNIAHWIQH